MSNCPSCGKPIQDNAVKCLECEESVQPVKITPCWDEIKKRHDCIYDNPIMGIYQITNNRFDDLNVAMAKMFKFRDPEEMKKEVRDIKSLYLDQNKYNKFLYDLFETDSQLNVEQLVRCNDGTHMWISESSRVINNENKQYVGFIQDITDRKEAQKKYEDIFQNAVVGIFQSTPNGRFITVNPTLSKMCNYTSPEEMINIIGDNIENKFYVIPARRNIFLTEMNKKGEVDNFEYEVYCKNKNSKIWISESARSVKGIEGEILYYEGFMRDITNRVKAMQDFNDVIDQTVDGFFRSTPDGKFILVNKALANIFGFHSSYEMLQATSDIGKQFYVNPQKRQEFLNKMQSEKEVRDFEYQAKTVDGKTIWIIENSRAVTDNDCEIMYYEGFKRDITRRKETEMELEAIFNNAPIGIFIIQNRKLQKVNPWVVNFTGLSEQQLIGMESLDFVHPEDRERVTEAAIEMVRGNRKEPYEFRSPDKGGNFRTILQLITSYPEYKRGSRATLGYAIDTTELANLKKKLEKTSDRIIGALIEAHEIRDPYTPGHQRCVSELAYVIGKLMGRDETECQSFKIAGLLHDIGKIHLPMAILSYPDRFPDKLKPSYMAVIQLHPQMGYDILKELDFDGVPIAEMVLQHHEKCDGSGYPKGLTGDQIEFGAKILAVADVIDAMSTARPYRKALSLTDAIGEIQKKICQYDANVVKIVSNNINPINTVLTTVRR